MKNIWRKDSTNVASNLALAYKVIIRRIPAGGWGWLLMMHEELVERGTARSRLAANEAARQAKALKTGRPVKPLAPTGKRGEKP